MMSKRTTKQGTAMAIAIMTLMGCDLAPAGDPEPERDIKYDTKHERNVLDFWPAPASDDPAPVYFWFHGGGFQNGDKSQLEKNRRATLEATRRYELSLTHGSPQPDALADVFKTILISPNFLLRVEQSSDSAKDQAVNGFDLAARLSYFLWASTPDDDLLDAAEAGALSDPSERRAQVEPMLVDPRSLSLGEIFAAEWFSTDDVGPRLRKDPIDNPRCTETLMAAMRAETAHFFTRWSATMRPFHA